MKVINSTIALGALFLSINGVCSGALSVAAPASGQTQTNQATASRSLEKIRQRLGDGNPNLLTLLKKDALDRLADARVNGVPAFTLQDGMYQLIGTPSRAAANEEAAQFSEEVAESDNFRPRSNRVHIDFSYPSATYHGEVEADPALDNAENPVADALITPSAFDGGSAVNAGTLAWSDNVSRMAMTLDEYVPANEFSRGPTIKPNVIIPEPSTVVLMAFFGGALLTFSSRRRAGKAAA